MKTITHDKICITIHINPRPVSTLGPTALGLILGSQVDMGCDKDFAMHYSLYLHSRYECIILYIKLHLFKHT